jgi:hypothetical protein
MRDLMNSQKQVLVRRRANDIRGQERLPRQKRRVAQSVRAEELQTHDGNHKRESQRLRAAELENL